MGKGRDSIISVEDSASGEVSLRLEVEDHFVYSVFYTREELEERKDRHRRRMQNEHYNSPRAKAKSLEEGAEIAESRNLQIEIEDAAKETIGRVDSCTGRADKLAELKTYDQERIQYNVLSEAELQLKQEEAVSALVTSGSIAYASSVERGKWTNKLFRLIAAFAEFKDKHPDQSPDMKFLQDLVYSEDFKEAFKNIVSPEIGKVGGSFPTAGDGEEVLREVFMKLAGIVPDPNNPKAGFWIAPSGHLYLIEVMPQPGENAPIDFVLRVMDLEFNRLHETTISMKAISYSRKHEFEMIPESNPVDRRLTKVTVLQSLSEDEIDNPVLAINRVRARMVAAKHIFFLDVVDEKVKGGGVAQETQASLRMSKPELHQAVALALDLDGNKVEVVYLDPAKGGDWKVARMIIPVVCPGSGQIVEVYIESSVKYKKAKDGGVLMKNGLPVVKSSAKAEAYLVVPHRDIYNDRLDGSSPMPVYQEIGFPTRSKVEEVLQRQPQDADKLIQYDQH